MTPSNLTLIGTEADDIMTERSLMRLYRKHGDPSKMTWQQIRERFTSHDLARALKYFIDKEAAEKVIRICIE